MFSHHFAFCVSALRAQPAAYTRSASTMNLIDLDDDCLLHILRTLPIWRRAQLLRQTVAPVCQRLKALAYDSAALDWKADVAFLGKTSTSSQAITPVLAALGALNVDGKLKHVVLGNSRWGSGSTKKLFMLFPALESIDFGNAKDVVKHHGFQDWKAERGAPASLRSFAWGWAFGAHTRNVIELVKDRPNLERLSLTRAESMGYVGASGLCDDLLEELGRSCPALLDLTLHGHLQITDRGIQSLLAGCKKLRSISLKMDCIFRKADSYVRLTDVAIGALRIHGESVLATTTL